MRRAIAASALAATALALGGGAEAGQAGTGIRGAAMGNPIVPHTGGDRADSPDPWIFRAAGRYHLTYTSYDHVELRRSATIGGLAAARPARIWPPRGAPEPATRCCHVWAPEFHRLSGPNGVRWYVYYSANDSRGRQGHRTHVLESAGQDPRGPYSYRGELALGDWTIDATILRQGTRLFAVYAGHRTDAGPAWSQQLFIAPLEDPWTVAGPPLLIAEPTFAWEQVGSAINEGPEVLRHGSRLHLIFSASSCLSGAYKLGRLTVDAGADLLDPGTWSGAKAPEPVFQGAPAAGVFGPGHGSFFKSPDGREDWHVYHATDVPGPGCGSGIRTTRAQRLTWAPDDTPRFGTPLSLRRDMRPPAGDATFARQIEDARVEARSGAPLRAVSSPGMVGGRGAILLAHGRGDFVAYRLRLRRGRHRILVRTRAGPGQGRVRLSAHRGGLSQNAPSRDAYSPRPGYVELDLGAVRVWRPWTTLRFTVVGRNRASSGYGFTPDQLRLAPGARPGS